MRTLNGFEEFFWVWALIQVMMTWFLSKGQVWKRVWILEVWSENGCGKWLFWSEIGSGFEEPGRTPPPKIPRSSLPPGSVSLTLFSVAFFTIARTVHISKLWASWGLRVQSMPCSNCSTALRRAHWDLPNCILLVFEVLNGLAPSSLSSENRLVWKLHF